MTDASNAGLIDSWQLSLHDKAASTRHEYRKQLRYFITWLTQTGRAAGGDLLEVARTDVEAWFLEMREAGNARSTISARCIALRSFYNWAEEEEEIDRHPLAKVKVTRGEEPPPDVISPDDFELLLKTCRGKGFAERRDMALLRFLVATGLRRAETADVQLPDVDLEARMAIVRHGKGDKYRAVRFDPSTAAAIDRYKRVRARHRAAGSPYLWVGRGRLGRLTAAGIAQVVERRAAQAGLEHLHPHQLRHTWADRSKRSGMSDEAVMILGGWEDPTVMRRYGKALAVERALAAYDEHDPMGRM